MDPYGYELILDLHKCNNMKFNRPSIKDFMVALCDKIEMKRADLHFWDDTDVPEEEKQTEPHTTGTSAVQFILTSNVTIHTLDKLDKVFINIFSCKHFHRGEAALVAKEHFGGEIVTSTFIERL